MVYNLFYESASKDKGEYGDGKETVEQTPDFWNEERLFRKKNFRILHERARQRVYYRMSGCDFSEKCASCCGFFSNCLFASQRTVLSAEPNQTMQEYYAFFESYFVEEERNAIITRLYKSKNNYYKNFKAARRHSNLVNQPTLTKGQPDEREVVLKTIFEDANGKAVKWVLRDVDPSKDKKEFEPILKILTTLSIFQKDGVRQFVSLVDSKRVKSEIEILVEKKTSPKKGKKIAAKKKTTSTSTQKNTLPKAGNSSSLEKKQPKITKRIPSSCRSK
jgi:hypothetical protein